MDPLLWELYESGSSDDDVSVIMRLEESAEPPPHVRVVSRFGEIATARLRRGDIPATHAHESVASLKAPRPLQLPASPHEIDEHADDDPSRDDDSVTERTPTLDVEA